MMFKTRIGMAVLKLLTGGTIFITAIFFFSDRVLGYNPDIVDEPIYRLPEYIIPVHYDIDLVLHIDEHTGLFAYDGELKAIIYIKHATNQINLHVLSIITKQINLTDEENRKTFYTYRKFSPETQMLEIHMLGGALSPGRYNLYITFNRTASSEGGFYRTSYIDKGHKKWMIATIFLPIEARQVFPCWDEPALKATFNISVKHHKKYKILSNMVPLYYRNLTNDMMRTYFRTTPEISTHQVAILMLNFEDIKSISYYHSYYLVMLSRQNANVEFARIITERIEEYLESKYMTFLLRKFQKTNYVAIPDFLYDGISHLGLVFYREEAITYDKKLDPMVRKIEVARLVSRHVTQQWFGGLVTSSWWSSWWLNDALATFTGLDAINKCFPDIRIMDMFVVQYLHESFYLNFYSYNTTYSLEVNSPSEINSLFSSSKPSYKVISILRMLQHLMTDRVFWYGIRRYTLHNEFNSITPDNIWKNMEDALIQRSSNVEPAFNQIIKKMNHWIELKCLVLKARRKRQWLYIEQETENVLELDWIPVTFTTEEKLDFTQISFHHTHYIMANTSAVEFKLNDTEGWIIVNLQQVGYYRVNYDLKNWQEIASYLKSRNYAKIHVLNRAQIINDAFHFLVARQFSSTSIFWDLTNYLSQETDYVAWYPMIKAMEYMSSIFPLSRKRVKYIKVKLLNILTEVLRKIQYEATPEEHNLTSCLREETTKWACVLGDRTCKRKAAEKLKWHLNNREDHKILPWWQDWTYCNGLKTAAGITWYDVIKLWRSKPNNIILEFLSCSENPLIIHHSLKTPPIISPLFRQKNDIEIMNYHMNSFLFIVARHAKNEEILKYILQHLDEIKPKQLDMTITFIIIINHVYSKEQLDKISEFVEKKMKHLQFDLQDKIAKFKMKTEKIRNMIKQLILDLEFKPKFSGLMHEEIQRLKSAVQNKIETYIHTIKNKYIEKLQHIVPDIQRKIKKRLSEIEKQMKYLQIFSNP